MYVQVLPRFMRDWRGMEIRVATSSLNMGVEVEVVVGEQKASWGMQFWEKILCFQVFSLKKPENNFRYNFSFTLFKINCDSSFSFNKSLPSWCSYLLSKAEPILNVQKKFVW